MGWVGALKNFWREFRDLQTVLSLPPADRRVLVYSEDVSSYIQFEGYLECLTGSYGQSVVYVTSAPDDPLFARPPARFAVYYVNRLVPTLMPRVDSDIFVTTMPDLGKLHVPRPKKSSRCLYVFHSLNSIHEVYRQGAFDHYDAFFCVGPHHSRELRAHFALNGLPMPILYEVGYYKLDRVYKAHRDSVKKHPGEKTILLAPSWGKMNLLESHGIQIVDTLLAMGVRVVVRPHPCFFLPMYPRGRQIVEAIEERFGDRPHVEIERGIETEESFHEADLMVSDFSGAAYEYALGTARPVLFVDVPRKTLNPDWHRLGLPTFEDTMRYEVGRVLGSNEIHRLGRWVDEMLSQPAAYAQRIEELRQTVIYNFGRSAEVGGGIIHHMLRESAV